MFIFSCLFAILLSPARGNTEIVNFDVQSVSALPQDINQEGVTFSAGSNRQRFDVFPAPLHTHPDDICLNSTTIYDCPHAVTLRLDFDHPDWTAYGRFTLRISWPASSPTDFFVSIRDPDFFGAPTENPTGTTQAQRQTRTKYAVVKLVDTGILTPSLSEAPAKSIPVPFIVKVEPLVLGFIPQSVIPYLYYFVPVLLGAYFIVLPRVSSELRKLAVLARMEAGEHARKKTK